VTNERIARETVLAELTARDLGHPVTINGMAGVLVRVLHEGGTESIMPTYIRLLTDGMTASEVGRFNPETVVIVHPLTQTIDAVT
jgi:hypothetical protein